MKRAEVEERLAAHYTAKLHGKVWAIYDRSRRAYCIRGEGLPAHPDLRAMYPNGWSLCDYIKPAKARALIQGVTT